MGNPKVGFVQGYNGQIAVDGKAQLIVAAELTRSASDGGQLIPTLEATCPARGPGYSPISRNTSMLSLPSRRPSMPSSSARVARRSARLIEPFSSS